jgi:hypothetical protein
VRIDVPEYDHIEVAVTPGGNLYLVSEKGAQVTSVR